MQKNYLSYYFDFVFYSLIIFFITYISAYSNDILHYYSKVNDRNLNIGIELVSVQTNDFFNKLDGSSRTDLINRLEEAKRFVASHKSPSSFVPSVKASCEVFANNERFFSAKTEILYEYYDLFPKAAVEESTINLRLMPDGKIENLKIGDLFEPNTQWQIGLLLKGIEYLKKGGFSFWDNSTIENEIKSGKNPFDYYFYSFVLTKRNSIIIIFQSLSIAPNAAGYPSVEIPLGDIPFLKKSYM